MPDTTTFENRLDHIEKLARGSIIRRFLFQPIRYAGAIGYWRLVYPFKKKGKFATARTFFGANMKVVLPSATEIFLFGAKTHDSEIRLARFLMKNLREGDVFCDVGAHYGYFTLLASHLVGRAGKVVSFEASMATFSILKCNTAENGNITIHHHAVSDKNKLLVFNEFPALFSEYNSLVLPMEHQPDWLKNNPPQRLEVQGIRLGDYFTDHQLVPVCIKIDVEGAEPEVLKGMEQFLKQHSPTLVMEYLIGGGQQEAHRQAVQFAEGLGYQSFRINNEGGVVRCKDLEAAIEKSGLASDNIVLRKPGAGHHS